jgi:hypothetical protein
VRVVGGVIGDGFCSFDFFSLLCFWIFLWTNL